ncbi:MAG TPA: hypothetical protein VFS90_02560 [Pyrinomonadaceae bacterium]|nr:hypothetical protein [Pyrinomonadaceae bacterium]
MHLSKPLVLLSILAVVGIGVVVALKQTAGTFTETIQNGKRIINVGPKDSLQAALNAANYGDTIVVQAGVTLSGNFTLPKKTGTGEIVIQSSRIGELPENVRVTPSKSALFARLQTPNTDPVIATAPGAHHYRFQGIEFSTADSTKLVYDVVRLGGGRKEQKTLDSVPHHLVIDRCYIHGFDTQDVQRGISLNSAETTITNSYISNIHGVGYDTQAIGGWNGPGPFHIVNNHLEGAGENIMFGGADSASEALLPSNIEIRGNYIFKPMSWKVGHPTYAGKHWTVKNLLELKSAKNVVIDGNVMENNWTDGQDGTSIVITVRNQECSANWSTVQQVKFTNNVVVTGQGGMNFLGKDNEAEPKYGKCPAGSTSTQGSDVLVSNNLFYDIKGPFLVFNGFNNVTFTHNTHIQTGNIMTLYGSPSEKFVYTDNLTLRGSKGYGLVGDGFGEGTVALRKYAADGVFRNNVLIGTNPSEYPKENQYPASVDKVGFVNFEKGDYRLSPRSPFKGVGADWDKLNFSAKTPE